MLGYCMPKLCQFSLKFHFFKSWAMVCLCWCSIKKNQFFVMLDVKKTTTTDLASKRSSVFVLVHTSAWIYPVNAEQFVGIVGLQSVM